MSLKPFNPFLIKRPSESNPLTKRLKSWKGPGELKQFDYGSLEWNMALMEYLLTHKGSKKVHDLLGAEVQLSYYYRSHIINQPKNCGLAFENCPKMLSRMRVIIFFKNPS